MQFAHKVSVYRHFVHGAQFLGSVERQAVFHDVQASIKAGRNRERASVEGGRGYESN